MDYKSVLEEQIRELQKAQDNITKGSDYAAESCDVARTIKEIALELYRIDNGYFK